MSGAGRPAQGGATDSLTPATVAAGTDSTLAGALEAVRRGMHVFPVRADKAPDCEHGHRDATTNPAVVQGWWRDRLRAGYGIACEPSGLVVVDVDVRDDKPGAATWGALVAEHGPVPATLEVRTPSGGRHIYFRAPTPLRSGTNALGPAVDVKSRGGYVVGPGSTNGAGGYTLAVDAPIAPLPEWIMAALAEPARPAARPPSGPLAPAEQLAARFEQLAGEIAYLREGDGANGASRLAFLAGQYCGAGQVDPVAATERLVAALDGWSFRPDYPRARVEQQIRKGVRDGMREPRTWTAAPPPSPGHLRDPITGEVVRRWERGVPGVDLLPVPASGRLADAVLAETAVDGCLRNRFLWNRGLGWLAWDGVAWRQGDDESVVEALRVFMISQYVAAARRDSDAERAWRSTLSRARLNAVADLARGMLAVPVEALDADPWALNTPGGIVDLRTGQLRPCDPAALLTRSTRVAPADAPSPVWEKFVGEILPDAEVRTYLQRALGLGLVGEVREHHLPILNGLGANGKSVLAGAVMHALGDLATEVDPELLVAGKHVRHRTFLMRLRGLRIAFVSETDRAATFAESELKRLTGGDPIEANLMHRDPITFRPSHSLAMITNHLPEVSGDPAVWRRLTVVPFDQVVPPERRDAGLPERLRAEAPGVLRWLLDGVAAYLREGLAPPEAVRLRTEQYRHDSDHVARFLGEVCEVGPACEVGAAELYAAWQRWALANGAKPGTNRDLPRALLGHGVAQKKRAAGQRYIGVSLRSTEGAPWWPNQG